MEKETDCLTNAERTRGICAFLGKSPALCDCDKDSVFNFSSSRVPKGKETWHGLDALFLLTLKSLKWGEWLCVKAARSFTELTLPALY